jgi:hypothetical protein
LVAVAVVSLVFIENPVTKWLVFIGASLSAIPVAIAVARLSTQIGRNEPGTGGADDVDQHL